MVIKILICSCVVCGLICLDCCGVCYDVDLCYFVWVCCCVGVGCRC